MTVILATAQTVCRKVPPGTLHFPKLSRCVFPSTALFALRPSPEHKSEPLVAVITAPLKRHDKLTNVTIPRLARSLFASTVLHTGREIRLLSVSYPQTQIMKVLLQAIERRR